MKIAIDLRSLQSGSISGVENYTLNLLEHMLTLDRTNQYTLFFNSWRKSLVPDFHFVNSQARSSRLPNKLLNLMLKLKMTNLEKFCGDFELLFLPNLRSEE